MFSCEPSHAEFVSIQQLAAGSVRGCDDPGCCCCERQVSLKAGVGDQQGDNPGTLSDDCTLALRCSSCSKQPRLWSMAAVELGRSQTDHNLKRYAHS